MKNRLDVFSIRKATTKLGGTNSYWTRCGVAFVNRDGSINVKLELMPFSGELHLRAARPREAKELAAAVEEGLES